MDEDKEKCINALLKRALGYDYEETTTLIEETPGGRKKKIQKTTKHVPPDPEIARYLLKAMGATAEDYREALAGRIDELLAAGGDG